MLVICSFGYDYTGLLPGTLFPLFVTIFYVSAFFFKSYHFFQVLIHFVSPISQSSNSRSEFVSKQGYLSSLAMMVDLLLIFDYFMFYITGLVRLQLQNELFPMI